MVSWVKVKFGEELGTMELIQEVINDWDRKFIFDGQPIDGQVHYIFKTMTTRNE